jgi:hypothetical protein
MILAELRKSAVFLQDPQIGVAAAKESGSCNQIAATL